MKKIIHSCIAACLLLTFSVSGSPAKNHPEVAPAAKNKWAESVLSQRNGNPSNSINRLFDIQFNHNASAQRPVTALGAVVWTGTEFWVSKWNGDSLFTFDVNGLLTSSFRIPGIGSASQGVRGMTWDGTHIYAGANTTTIYQIDPVAKTLIASFPAPIPVRGIAYDSTANAGSGGFWISNFNTDIILVSRTGTTLSTITAANHGLTGMYGLAFDPYTNGGPFLWAFDQSTSSSRSDLVRIEIAAQGPDGIKHNVMLDVGLADGGSSGLAGGLHIAWNLDPAGGRTIVGLLQGTPNIRLFGYELNDYTPPVYDAAADTLSFEPPFTFTPGFLTTPVSWNMDATNFGSLAIDSLRFIVNVDTAGTVIFSDTGLHLNLGPLANTNVQAPNSFLPIDNGAYRVTGFLNTGIQVDEVNINDTIRYIMNVTDTTLGKDNNIVQGSLGIGNGTGGLLGQKFVTPALSYASSASFFLRGPTMGDSVRAELYSFNGLPDMLLGITSTYVITGNDTDGVQLTLPFLNNLIMLPAGEYLLAIREYSANITLGTSGFNFRPAHAFYKIGTGNWTRAETGNFRITYLLRLNLQDPVLVNVPVQDRSADLQLYPNPSNTNLYLDLKVKDPDASLSIIDISGKQVLFRNNLSVRNSISVQDLPAGIYVARIQFNNQVLTRRISIIR